MGNASAAFTKLVFSLFRCTNFERAYLSAHVDEYAKETTNKNEYGSPDLVQKNTKIAIMWAIIVTFINMPARTAAGILSIILLYIDLMYRVISHYI